MAIVSGSGGYTCTGCGVWVGPYDTHSCPATRYVPTTSTTPSAIPWTVHTGSPHMKHINWEEYTPARPPLIGSDYLIVYIDQLTGTKKCTRGSFNITGSYKHEWSNEIFTIIQETVTHFAKIELPI